MAAQAHSCPEGSTAGFMRFVGKGEAKQQPDVATLSAAITASAWDVKQAHANADAATKDLAAAITKACTAAADSRGSQQSSQSYMLCRLQAGCPSTCPSLQWESAAQTHSACASEPRRLIRLPMSTCEALPPCSAANRSAVCPHSLTLEVPFVSSSCSLA